MDEKKLIELLTTDFSAGSEAFSEQLLERCAAVLNPSEEFSTISEGDLELLAAAGEPEFLHKQEEGSR